MKVSDEMVERAATELKAMACPVPTPGGRHDQWHFLARKCLEVALENTFIAHPELFVAPRGHSPRCRILDIPAQYHGKRVALVPLDD